MRFYFYGFKCQTCPFSILKAANDSARRGTTQSVLTQKLKSMVANGRLDSLHAFLDNGHQTKCSKTLSESLQGIPHAALCLAVSSVDTYALNSCV